MTGFWYLATPYSKYPQGREVAYRHAIHAAVICIQAGIKTFCPIAHTHVIASTGELDGGFDQWADFDEAMIRAAAGVIVVEMDGWRDSIGVLAEIGLCKLLGKPVLYMPAAGPAPEIPRHTQAGE